MLASSSIIQNIIAMEKAGLASLAFFYCDFREDQKKDLRGLLLSLVQRHQSDSYCDILFKFYSEHAEGLEDPSDDELVGCLKNLLKHPGCAPVFLVVDALDECPSTSAVRPPRAKVLNLVEELVDAVTVEAISENLYTSGQPDPDLVIRTSGEQRLSGFLLWQSAYSEMWFCEAHWPAFRRVDFLRALRDYSQRHRRYGK